MATEKEPNPLNIRSDDIQDIMSKTPSWMIRWGITTIFIIIILGILMTYLIEYPEIIKGPVEITTSIPPMKVVSQTSGNVTHIFVEDGQVVKAGTVLAEIENPITNYAINYLKSYAVKLDKAIEERSTHLPVPDTTGVALGDLQVVMNELHKEIFNYNLRKEYKIDDVEYGSLQERINHEQELLSINEKMLGIAERDLENSRIKYESDKLLFEQGVISKTDFIQQESNFRTRQLAVEQLRQTRVQTTMTLNALRQDAGKFGYNKMSRDQSGFESIKAFLESMRSYIIGWQQRYSLIAPADGTVTFVQNLLKRKFIRSGEEIFAILQPENSYTGFALIPSSGMGKVAIGQHVNILLEHYPYYEFGTVDGKVMHIALLPNGTEYRVEISLPNGMKSTAGKPLKFTPEMTGVAEIITEDKKVIERIFDSFIKVFKKR